MLGFPGGVPIDRLRRLTADYHIRKDWLLQFKKQRSC